MTRRKTTQDRADAWVGLRRLTAARIALGRAGTSLPTAPHLAFQLAHAHARDAVHAHLDGEALGETLRAAGHQVLQLASAAPDRTTYLQRPDLGRMLASQSRALLDRRKIMSGKAGPAPGAKPSFDAAIVIADGLSALAVKRNAAGVVAALVAALPPAEWKFAPVSIVAQGRVAVGDEIGQKLGAALVVVLIGERPGLTSPDSLGAYLTWAPRIHRTDAERNCIANIRDGGQSHAAAAATLAYLMTEARRTKLSGVGLKDETVAPRLGPGARRNFLVEDGGAP